MSTELTRTRDHLKVEAYAMIEAIITRNLDAARDHAMTVVQLINHLAKLEHLEELRHE